VLNPCVENVAALKGIEFSVRELEAIENALA